MFQTHKKQHPIWLMLAFLLAFISLLSGCASPTSEPVPTALPEATQTPEVIVVTEQLLETVDQSELFSATWQWIGLRETMPTAQSMIPDA